MRAVDTVVIDSLKPDQTNELLQSIGAGETVYLIGAGGCGMSGLGHLLVDLGFHVVGSDLIENDEIRQLRARGASIHIGHEGPAIHDALPKLIVYSSAIRAGNAELAAARELLIPIVRRGICLAALLQRQRGICIAGMHGKTTTSALLAFALEKLDEKPSYAIGAVVPQLKPHARFSYGVHALACSPGTLKGEHQTPFFVVEADESDGTLREFRPENAIVLNVDAEHLDYYGGFEAVCSEFELFGRQTAGRLVYCADDAELVRLFGRRQSAVSYGFSAEADYRVEIVAAAALAKADAPEGDGVRPSSGAARGAVAEILDDFIAIGCTHTAATETAALRRQGCLPCMAFSIWHSGERLGNFRTQLPGEQNVSNATGVIALLHQLGFLAEDIARAIELFQGAARRQQVLYQDRRFRVVEDYGHHPTEIRATLRALRQWAPKRLLVAFQPHRFSRTKLLLDEFASCFDEADRLWLTDVYAASESPWAGVNGKTLADTVRQRVQALEYVPNLDDLPVAIEQAIAPGDLVLFLGAGDITRAAHMFVHEMENGWAKSNEALYRRLAARLSSDSLLKRDEPLAKRTTLRVGGRADFYVEPASEADLSAVLKFCQEFSVPFLILGRGSNLLIRDEGIRGVVICLARPAFGQIRVQEDQLICGAGVKLRAVAVEAKRHSISGMEFLEGIPGSVGGALRMNAGAMGGAMFEIVESVRYMDFAGNAYDCPATELPVNYRSCPFFKNHIALGAILHGRRAQQDEIAEKMTACSQKRWKSQPAVPSAGCMFKNPTTIPAGKLIEELGLKGTRVGGAVVSDVHGNFIVNDGNATARDVLQLIELIRQRAKEARGIELETEVEIVGSA